MLRAAMLSAVVLCAQSGDWAQVRALPTGARVDVQRIAEKGKVRGVVEHVSGDELIVCGEAGSVRLSRADVRRVRLYTREKRTRGRATGVAILGGLGLVSTVMSDTKTGGSGKGRLLQFPVLAGAGYLIGWGADRPKRTLVYRAP